MKKLLIAFGILDILTIIRSFTVSIMLSGIGTPTQVLLLTIVKWALYTSLVFSAFFLIQQKRIGILLSYWQFPVRVFLMAYSFGFILTISDLFYLGNFDRVILWGILGLEIVRLVLTIFIHRKFYLKTSLT